MDAKLKRRLHLMDDLLDFALRSNCHFSMCNGPEAPIRDGQTCVRCACIHRAIQMGLVKKVTEGYIRDNPGHIVPSCYVSPGKLEQFSAVTGELVR